MVPVRSSESALMIGCLLESSIGDGDHRPTGTLFPWGSLCAPRPLVALRTVIDLPGGGFRYATRRWRTRPGIHNIPLSGFGSSAESRFRRPGPPVTGAGSVATTHQATTCRHAESTRRALVPATPGRLPWKGNAVVPGWMDACVCGRHPREGFKPIRIAGPAIVWRGEGDGRFGARLACRMPFAAWHPTPTAKRRRPYDKPMVRRRRNRGGRAQ